MEDQAQVCACAIEYLNRHSVLCLASTRDNQPWVAPVFYAVWQNSLLFLSAPHTRHCKNLELNPLASGSIQEDYANWKNIKGIQLEGRVERIAEHYRRSAIDCYVGKFPVTGTDAPVEIANALDKVSWYQLVPSRMYLIDNSKGLGNRDEVDLKLLFKHH